MSFDPADPDVVRDLSWIGDAVLGLCAREWIIENEARLGANRTDLHRDLTSNRFLAVLGPPTVIEARIGDAYRSGGLPAAREVFDTRIVPVFLKQLAKRKRARQE